MDLDPVAARPPTPPVDHILGAPSGEIEAAGLAPLPPAARSAAVATPDAPPAAAAPAAPEATPPADDPIVVAETRGAEGFGFFITVRATGQMFRVSPSRDPHQPRFWCITIRRVSSAGAVDPAELPWFGATGMTREELPTVLASIRADLGGWLDRTSCAELRAWLLTPVVASPTAAAVARPRNRTGTPADAAAPLPPSP